MKRKLLVLASFLLLVLLALSSCDCKEHEWEGEIVQEASCTESGLLRYTCKACGEVRESELAPLGHEWIKTGEEIQPTCLAEGSETYACLLCGETEERVLQGENTHVYGQTSLITKAPTETENGEITYYCNLCLNPKTETLSYEDYKMRLDTANGKSAAMADSLFGGVDHTVMVSSYAAPEQEPTSGSHPRLLLTSADLPKVKAAMNDPANTEWLQGLLTSADQYHSGLLGLVKTYEEWTAYGPKGTHNGNDMILSSITSKAFLYLTTDVELYGKEAILMIKEYITTLKLDNVHDECRYWGETMFVAALVYDWCYDLLTEQDKTQLISGIEHKIVCGSHMEVEFPPIIQTPVVGHGAERQIQRDYLSFAVAIFDEEPSWYNLIAGRIYEQFVPVRKAFYEATMVPQGISCYVRVRFDADVWCAWILKCATGVCPYDADDMSEVVFSLFSYITDGNYEIFDEGDDELSPPETLVKALALPAAVTAHLFGNSGSRAWAEYLGYYGLDEAFCFLLNADDTKADENRFDSLSLIDYNGGFERNILSHSSHEEDAASTFMKIGERVSGNHDHADAGSFQIYYKGLLTGDTGIYDVYGKTHHYFYQQSTVAHNSLLIYKTMRGTTRVYGQKISGEAGSLEAWLSSYYKVATQTGMEYGYTDETEKTPAYAYIAGDLAEGYETGLVTALNRRMLTVYETGNPDVPLYFFVYDNAVMTSPTIQLSFLLHTYAEPTVNADLKTVTVVNGGGKLVLQNVLGASDFLSLGGENKNFLTYDASKKEYVQLQTLDGSDDGSWGRVEILSTVGTSVQELLNVMFVTDADKSPELVANAVNGTDVSGAVIGNVAAVFYKDGTRATTPFSFEPVSTAEELTYYVSGVSAGDWTVSVGNKTLTVTATEEGGLLVFKGPAAMVTLTPAAQ